MELFWNPRGTVPLAFLFLRSTGTFCDRLTVKRDLIEGLKPVVLFWLEPVTGTVEFDFNVLPLRSEARLATGFGRVVFDDLTTGRLGKANLGLLGSKRDF